LPGQTLFHFNRKCSPFVPRGRTIVAKALSPVERAEAANARLFARGWDRQRPKTRADCEAVPRPCPWVSCKYNLFLDVNHKSIKLNFPDREPHQMAPTGSCALDVADRVAAGEQLSLEDVGHLMNLGIERVRQLSALAAQGARVKINWEERLTKVRLPVRPGGAR
jgi:hypothetical protein